MNKTQIRLYQQVEMILNKNGFLYTKHHNDFFCFEVNTRFGKWRIRPEHENRSKLVKIYTRFDHPEIIDKSIFKEEEFSFDSFSGKLNFYYFNKDENIMLGVFDRLCRIVNGKEVSIFKNELLNYLIDFMIQNNWYDDKIPEQARAIFTTICFIGNIAAYTKERYDILYTLYWRADLEELIEFEDFESYMMELIV